MATTYTLKALHKEEYIKQWNPEISQFVRMAMSASREDCARIQEIQDELTEIMERTADLYAKNKMED